MIAAAWLMLCTAGSSITIWFVPCLVTTGSETPSESIRFRITFSEIDMSSGVSLWVRGGFA